MLSYPDLIILINSKIAYAKSEHDLLNIKRIISKYKPLFTISDLYSIQYELSLQYNRFKHNKIYFDEGNA